MTKNQLKIRRDGKPAGTMSLEQIKQLPKSQLDGLEVFMPDVGGWVWPVKWNSDGSDIEVVI